jgi:hypothetical protein
MDQLLPIAKRVYATTVDCSGNFASKEELDEVKNRVISENRDRKIDSVLENKGYEEIILEDDEEYKRLRNKGVKPMSPPSLDILWVDYQYKSI